MSVYTNTIKESTIKHINELPEPVRNIVIDINSFNYNNDNCTICKIPIKYYNIVSKFLKRNFGYTTKINGTFTNDYSYDVTIYYC